MNQIKEARLFSKLAIVLFSIFGSTLFGAVLFSDNLRQIGLGKKSFSPIVFALVYNFLVSRIIQQFQVPIAIFPLNFVGGVVLAFVFWKELIGEEEDFKTRPVWGPLMVIVLLYSAVFILTNR